MTQVFEYKRDSIVVHADGPAKDDTYTFQMIMVRPDALGKPIKTEHFYQRDRVSWLFLDGDRWFRIDPRNVPFQVRDARIKYGLGEIKQGPGRRR